MYVYIYIYLYVYIYIYLYTHTQWCVMSWVMSMCMYRYTILPSGCDRKQSCSSHLQTKWRRQWLSWSPKWMGFGLHVTTGGWSDRGASNHLREHWRKVQACKGQGDKHASGFQVMILCVRVYTHIIVIYGFCMCMRVYTYICVYNRYIHIRIGVLMFEVFKVQSIPAATKMHSTASFWSRDMADRPDTKLLNS